MKNRYKDVLSVINAYIAKNGEKKMTTNDFLDAMSACYDKGYNTGHQDGAIIMRDLSATYLVNIGEINLAEDVRDLILEVPEEK